MGLFDTVRCEFPLTNPRLQDAEFQTKDLECFLETYTITADGRLMWHARRGTADRAELDRDVEWPIHGDIPDLHRRPGPGARPGRPRRPVHPWARRVHPPTRRGRVAPWRAGVPGPHVRDAELHLLDALHRDRADLRALLEHCDGHWGGEDAVYRFYHQSFKVYALQETTTTIVERLRVLAPDRELNRWFLEIVGAGTGLAFAPEHNARWPEVTRPILEAYFHARYFLEIAVRYGDLERPPDLLPTGWAALLSLYGLR
jgi:hypothetical protein